jgi:hypothetical protein
MDDIKLALQEHPRTDSERGGAGAAGGDGMSLIDLYVRDKSTGKTHKVGSDMHDGLWVDSNGTVHYQNLQNGDGCNANSHNDTYAGYEFMPSDFGALEATHGQNDA